MILLRPLFAWQNLARLAGLVIVGVVVALVVTEEQLQTTAIVESLLLIAAGLLGLRWVIRKNGNGGAK